MQIYHGGFMEISEPKILKPNHSMDFGTGFYTTTSFEQAKKWSLIKKDRFNYDKSVVTTFEMDNSIFKNPDLKTKVFHNADEEWLDFVFANRNGSYNGEHYDIVFGPVANDTIYRTFIAYEEGILTEDETVMSRRL